MLLIFFIIKLFPTNTFQSAITTSNNIWKGRIKVDKKIINKMLHDR